MPRFAAAMNRVNTAVQQHLANATALFDGGIGVDVLFSNAPRDAFNLVAGTVPIAQAPTPALDFVRAGDALRIDGIAYTVAERNDDAGMTTLILEAA